MVKIFVSNSFTFRKIKGKLPNKFIATRPLTTKEISVAKKNGISRYRLLPLESDQANDFTESFDRFWDSVTYGRSAADVFWRNVVSSKMQEWDRSAGYLALILFTLSKNLDNDSLQILFICSSIQEENVVESYCLKKGWEVYRDKSSITNTRKRFVQTASNLLFYFLYALVCLYKKWTTPARNTYSELDHSHLLIVSLFYISSIDNGEYQDPFFGNLHGQLSTENQTACYTASPIGNYRKAANKLEQIKDVPIFMPLSVISWTELVRLMVRLLVRRTQFNGCLFDGCDFSTLLSWNSRRFDHFFNFDAEIFYSGVQKLCRQSAFEKLLVIYEGNVFERACMQAFRECCSGRVTGYSHAVVFSNNLKIRLTEGEKRERPEPDLIVTTGPETRDLLITVGNHQPGKIISGCSLRYIPDFDIPGENEEKNNILLALDGVFSTVAVMDWIMAHSNLFVGYLVTIRSHPNMPAETILSQCIHEMPANFNVSRNSLKEDLQNCFCVIYRQTSVGLQALMNGIPAVHLAIDTPLNADPISSLSTGKWSVSSPSELQAALKEIETLEDNQRQAAVETAKQYSLQYFAKPDAESVKKFYGL